MGAQQSETAIRIPLTDLIEDDGNVRSKLTGIEELAESLNTVGQLQPILVTKTAAGEAAYRVVAGHRRLAAARLAGIEALTAIVVDGDLASTRTVQLVENIQREDLPALDIADALREMMADEKNAETLARRVSKAGSWVRRHLALLKLDPEVVKAIRKGRLSFAQAEEVARIAKSSVKEGVTAANLVRDGKASSRELRAMADDAKKATGEPRSKRFDARGAGFVVELRVQCDRLLDDVAEGQLRSIAEAAGHVLDRFMEKSPAPEMRS
ncbi:MAG: ParB/RepB/Spo0J family partition protein [Deltaproteobacteria bacterium]|nr:ParB/RepB/Spo0J family partition protein [Deltaproteobacteria bacterium]